MNETNDILQKAVQYYRQGQYEEAKDHLYQMLKINPQNAEAHGLLGGVLKEQERYNEAKDHYRKALDINPQKPETHYDLGFMLAQQERYEEAKNHLYQILDINPQDAEVHTLLGGVLEEQERYEEAKDHYRKALDIDSQLFVAHSNLGAVLAQQERFEEAEGHYQNALDINPLDSETHFNLSSLLKEQGRYEEADVHLRQALNINPQLSSRLRPNLIPDELPRTPDVSVEYNSLTDRESIGGGGNADVMKATLPTPDGDVTLAIKEPRMSGTLNTDTVRRMLEEAKTWDKLDDHDHIVGVIDYGSAPIPWIAMEYMDAGHLGERSGELGSAQALWTSIAITKGVRHAHRRGVAHLDLKPENVLLCSIEDAWDVPKVADWGLSKHLLNHSKSVEGLSPQYAAPEQFDEDFGSADEITDIYQLGAVFYELFTGQPPFEGKPAKAMHKVLHEQPTPPSEIVDVPDELDEILLTALAKEKDDRYDNIVYLRDALQDLYDEE